MKTLFGLSKKAFISLSCIAVALIASGIVIGVAVSHNLANNDGNNSVATDDINKNGTDAGSPDKNGSVASADKSDVSSEGNSVTLDDAKKAALADAGLSESDVSFAKTEQDMDDNAQVYDIVFSTADKKYEYEVNASDGSIIERDVRSLTIPQSSLSGESSTEQYISVDKAKEIALKDAKLSSTDVKFTKSELDTDSGIKVYDIEFTAFDKKYEYEIGAVDGSIIEMDIRMLSFIPSSGTSENSGADQYIGLESAKETALNDANVTSSDVTFTKTRLDSDDSTPSYDIEFQTKDKKYDYEIDALSGNIVEKDIKTLTTQQTTTPSGDYIGVDKAKQIALSDANVSASDASFTKTELDSDDSTPKYDIEFRTSDKKYDYEINAANGNIIEKDIETIRTPQTSKPSGNTGSSSYIGLDKAKQIALSDANVSASDATFTKTSLDSDDRTPKYDIEFRTSDKKYDYEINAANGNIIEKDIETIRTPQTSKPSGNTGSSNYIGLDKAKQIALSDANVSASDAAFTKTSLDSDDRTPKYDIEFRTSDKKYDYEINAANGNIIEKDIETIRTPQTSKPSGNTGNSDYIGIDEAKQVALSHAGLSESDVRFTKSELDRDDGRYEYEIEFVSGRTEYEYKIDAVSGKILEHDSDYDD